jgi:hypothetical protein
VWADVVPYGNLSKTENPDVYQRSTSKNPDRPYWALALAYQPENMTSKSPKNCTAGGRNAKPARYEAGFGVFDRHVRFMP